MPSPPQFFRILLHSNIEDPKLMIPKIFVKDYGKLLSSFVFLKLPDGMEWKVGLTTAANGAVWLQKGWDKFLEHYCLEFGSLLVFRLLDGRKSSSFDVTIFDPTGVETQYSCNVNNCTPDSDCDESLEGFEGLLKKRKKASVPCFRSCKKTRKQDSFSIKVEPVEEVAEGCRNFSDIPNCKKKMPKEDEVWISNKGQVLKNKGESTEKPGFKVVMSQSNVGGRFNMAIPEKFARKYLCEEFGSISLQTTNGRKWAVLYKWSRNKDEKVAYFCSGWRVFVQENLLKAGDVVFFEPIKKHRFLFTKLQDTAPFSSPSPNNKIASTRNPFFKVKIHLKSYGNAVLNIPMGFAKKHLSPEMYYAKLQVRNKEWNVTLKQYESHSRFSAGWSKFYHENGLRDGNTCLFEMMLPKKFITDYGKFLSNSICLKLPDGLEWKLGSKTANDTVWLQNGWQQFSNHYRLKPGSLLVFRFDGNSTFQTCIFDQTCLEIQYPSNNIGKTKPDDEEFNGYRYEEVETNNHEINDLKPEKIGFKIVVKKSTVEGRYNMLIPKHFASKHLKEEFGRIEIENSDGESWAMSYKWSQSRNVAEYVYISSGWKTFAQENHLKEGNILFFQLIKKHHFLFTLEGTTFSPPISAKNTNVKITTPNNNLFFKVNIHKKSYKNSVLNIPLTFAENHLSSKMNIAKLIVGKKQWKVKMKHYERCIRFSGGWGEFFRQNDLKCGDSCLFELLNKNESYCIFKVNISKKT